MIRGEEQGPGVGHRVEGLRELAAGWRLCGIHHLRRGVMPGFVQIIEFKTSQPNEVRALADEFRAESAASSGAIPVTRGTFTQDRDRPGVYLNMVEFESYDAAMANSNRPETQKFAERMAELCDGPPKFLNLDIVEVWEP
jgi:quinol monooxygenase YgiN